MLRERNQIRATLSLGTLLRVNAVSGFAIGIMFGVFAGVVSFLVHRSLFEMALFILIAPPVTALSLSMITLIGHPMYVMLTRARFPGLDLVSYEETSR